MRTGLTAIVSACLVSLPVVAFAQAPAAPAAPTAGVTLRVAVPSHCVGATAAVEVSEPGVAPRRITAVIQGTALELELPGLPKVLTISWSPRVLVAMPLPDGAAAAAATPAAGRRLLDLRVVNHALQLSNEPVTATEHVPAAGRFGGRRGAGMPTPSPEQQAAQDSIRLATAWLTAHQLADGSWPGAGNRGECLPTAAACVALLSAGNTFRDGPHAAALRRGLCWLVEASAADTGRIQTPSDAAPLEEQALLALALSEAQGLSNFPPLRGGAEKAVAALSAMLTNQQGSDRTDACALAFAALTLVSARESRLAPPAGVLRDAASRLDGGDEVAPLRDAATMLVGQYLQLPEMTAVERRAPRLLANLPARGANLDTAYVYFGTTALYQAGEPHWSTWSATLAPALLAAQTKTGDDAGAWQPTDPRAQMRGRCWTSAMRLLTLQTYHRILMIR